MGAQEDYVFELAKIYQGKIDALRARVRELEDEVFRTRNRVVDDLLEIAGKNICDPLAGVSVAALHAYRAPTAPREAAMERLRALPRMPYSVVAYSSATPTEITGAKEFCATCRVSRDTHQAWGCEQWTGTTPTSEETRRYCGRVGAIGTQRNDSKCGECGANWMGHELRPTSEEKP
jgi:hypothetical protein